jgi:Bacterial pre-peptidase C-terminal domain
MLKRLHPAGQFHTACSGGRWDRDCRSFDEIHRARQAAARNRPNLERLEPRHMLSASPSSIASLAPYSGEQLSQSPQELVIAFNGVNVPALMGNFDVQIEELNRNGTKTPLWNPIDAPPEYSDITGTELIIPLQKFDSSDYSYDNITLPAGQYEIDLVGGTSIAYAASGADGPGPQLWNPTADHAIGTFTILGQGATIGPADNSLVPGQTTWGWLDPSNPSAAVDIYQFTLPSGNLWQVGLGISANSIGSHLLTDLSLFAPNGTLIATSNAGTGIPSNPNDPYLFTGLEGGTYYVGVSGAGNLPYGPGGYDPVLGIPGINDNRGSAGLFALNLVASPHEQATRLENFSLDYGAADTNSPTGLTLNFSGPIDLSNLFIPDAQETALEVVDSAGEVWPVTAASYEVTGASLLMIFDRPLPAGNYTLLSAPGDGLVDLAGQPVLPADGSSSVLATWSVAPQTGPPAANDLGVLWPFSSSGPGSSEPGLIQASTELAPGQAVGYRFTVIVPGFHKLETQAPGGDIAVAITENGVTTILDPGNARALNDYVMQLNDGVYTVRFVNVNQQQSTTLTWQFKIEALDWEKVLNNGVSQTSALSVSLFAAPVDDSGGGSGSNSAGSSGSIAAFSASAQAANFAGSMGPIPNSLVVTLNTGLIGTPALASQSPGAVGPMVDGGSTALANSGNGLDPAIRYESALADWLADEAPLAELKGAGPQPAVADSAVITASVGDLARLGSLADSARADERALGQAEWLLRLGARVQGWFGAAARVENDQIARGMPVPASELAQNTPAFTQGAAKLDDRNRRESSAAQVDLGAATCAILVGTAVCKLRRPMLKWWKAHPRMLAGPRDKSARPLHRGPHAVLSRSQARTRSHQHKALR